MESNSKNVLVAAVTGLAIGAIAGILLAPAKGADTRAAISGKASDIKDKVVGLKDQIFSKGNNPMDMLAHLKDNIEAGFAHGKADLKSEMMAKIKEIEASLKKA